MKIGLIGCGRVGTTIFYLLKKTNNIVGVYDCDKKNEKRALLLLRIKENVGLKELCEKTEALFIATPDDRILDAYKKILPYFSGKKYVFHFSGQLSADVFPRRKNLYCGSAHPFATFPKILIPPKRKNYPLFIEGEPLAIKALRHIFVGQYFTIKKITKREKTFYHLIGVFSSNFLVGLVSAINDLARKTKWQERDMRRVVIPIMKETLDNLEKYKLKNALSGPLERGDIGTIKKHLKVLAKDKNLSNVYKTLSLIILKNILRGSKRGDLEKIFEK